LKESKNYPLKESFIKASADLHTND
jgi:hypothetical protein